MKIRRTSLIVFVAALLFSIFIQQGITAKAETSGNLKATVTTEKQSYNKDEEIKYNVTITNNSGSKAKNIVVTSTLPDELEVILAGGNINKNIITWNIAALGEYEATTLSFTARMKVKTPDVPPVDTDVDTGTDNTGNTGTGNNPPVGPSTSAPQTGDTTNLLKYFIILAASVMVFVFAVIIYRAKKLKKGVALLVAFTFAASLFNYSTARAEDRKEAINATNKITISDKEYICTVSIEGILDVDTHLLLNVNRDSGTPLLQWKGIEGAAYKVIRGEAKDKLETLADNISEVYFADDGSNPDKGYFYRVIAKKDGKELYESTLIWLEPFIDSDKDGVTDSQEAALKTDPKNPDTDGDKIIDGLEVLALHTNPLVKDTDNDGIDDYEEAYVLHTNPILLDTNGNGINDGDEDIDSDGLTNIQEYAYESSPVKADTDNDGLKDGEEVNKYKTSPAKYDTDNDGLSDGEEIALGLNPLKESTDNITPDSKRSFNQSLSDNNIDETLLSEDNLMVPSLSGNVPGVINNNISITNTELEALQENRAILGEPITIESKYSTGLDIKLSFNYSKLLKDYDEGYVKNLGICGFEDGNFVVYDTSASKDSKTISANLSKAGTYFVLNIGEFLNSLGIDALSNVEKSFTTPMKSEAASLAKQSSEKIKVDEKNSNDVPKEWYDTNYKKQEDGSLKLNESLIQKDTKLPSNKVATDKNNLSAPSLTAGEVKGQADITFVIDSTGSMYSAINNVANNINTFVDRLTTEYNVQVNFSIVDYKDITEDGIDTTRVIKNGTSNWYSNVPTFKDKVNSIYVSGGGDNPETAIDALGMANKLDYRRSVNKFIILVTDADYKVDNRYGIASMTQMANNLKSSNIITSVVAPTYEKESYRELFESTDGIYADIYGNFSSELLKLADKIGKVTSDGAWVILKDYQYIKLNDVVSATNLVDSDGDKVTDYKELGELVERDLNPMIKYFLKVNGVPYEDYTGVTSVSVYNYKSHPLLVDTDFDGRNDNIDKYPMDNSFEGKLNNNGKINSDVSYKMDYRTFFKNNENYNIDLSIISSITSSLVYSGFTFTDKSKEKFELNGLMAYHGMEDVKIYKLSNEYKDQHLSEIAIGHRRVTYNGKTKNIVAVFVRGTNSTIEEWSSNFDIGDTTDFGKETDWQVKENHKGFDIAAARILKYVNNYILDYVDKTSETVIWAAGHSRGAAIANILGARLTDSGYQTFTYTFATPNTTTNSSAASYKGIFNIVNTEDFVPNLPMTAWGFTKYGKTATMSVGESYEKEWLDTTHISKYKYDTKGVQNTVTELAEVAENRVDAYRYTCSCTAHDDGTSGDGTSNNISVNNFGISEKSRNDAIAKIPANARAYCKITKFGGFSVYSPNQFNFTICQTPEYFMQLLAAYTAGTINWYRFGVELNIADRYEDAKTSLIGIGLAGAIEHPHYQESYYILANHIGQSNFK